MNPDITMASLGGTGHSNQHAPLEEAQSMDISMASVGIPDQGLVSMAFGGNSGQRYQHGCCRTMNIHMNL